MPALVSSTYFPPAKDHADIQEVSNFLDAYRSKNGTDPSAQCFLSGSDAGEQVALPRDIYEVLIDVVKAMSQGMAVTVRPNTEQVTTQQAADILGVSRPTIVRLIDNGTLPAERIGRHRRLRLVDVLNHQRLRSEAQMDAIIATSDRGSEIPSREFFKRARKHVAAEQNREG